MFNTRQRESMEKLEVILTTWYEKVLFYIKKYWTETLESIQTFDYIILLKVSSVLLFGYFLAKFFSRHIPKLIHSIAQTINVNLDNDFTLALRTFIFQITLFLFVLISVNILNLSESIHFILSAIVKSILILSLVAFLLKSVKLLLLKMANTPRDEKDTETVKVVQESTLPLFENTALILFAVVGIYQVFAIWHVDMTALLAGAGIGAMAIGMAAKDTLSDIIAGILILTDAPYRVGDVVYVRNDLKGRVSQIGLRNTRIVTKNNVEVIVPNTIMGTSQIVNESSSKKEGIRIHIDIAVSNNENVSEVKKYLLQAVEKCEKIAQDKKKKAIMIGFEMDMLQLRTQCWVNDPEDKGDAKAELMENIYLLFREVGIDITLRRYQHIKVSHEDAQELYIKEFPNTKQEMHIKEIPNLFGNGSIKKLTKVSKNPTEKKDKDEK